VNHPGTRHGSPNPAEPAEPAEPACRAAVLTPAGRGAVACLALDGPGAQEVVRDLFQAASGTPVEQLPPGQIAYGFWDLSGSFTAEPNGLDARPAAVGEQVVVCCRSNQSIEVHCHGGATVVEHLLRSLANRGCPTVSPEAWVAAREVDFLAAEARLDLAQARTENAAAVLLDQYRGALARAVTEAMGHLESGRRELAGQLLRQLADHAAFGVHLTGAWQVVLVGKTNTGKSSLMNRLLGYVRSLVHDQSGTTRDVVTAASALEGWPIDWADTAGSRPDATPLEEQGIHRAAQAVAQADLVVVVADAAGPWTHEDLQWLSTAGDAGLLVHNKIDLVAVVPPDRPAGLPVSARTGQGLNHLRSALARRLFAQGPAPGSAVPFRPRHAQLIAAARKAIEQSRPADAAMLLRRLLAPAREISPATQFDTHG
jgi:tRNA modification GTPase